MSTLHIIYNYYYCQKNRHQNFGLFEYMYIISIYPQKLAIFSGIEFESSHLKYQTHIQQYFMKSGSQAEIKLLELLFDNDGLGNIIHIDDFKTIEGYNNIVTILLALFMP